ncbi:hypothetical protein PAXRUDRAFT_90683, partial [Paxillus rubicundulus Ve08.2h10]
YSQAIYTAVSLTKSTLNCYYSLTDSSEVYYIAMGIVHCVLSLHPCHKLVYFMTACWEDDWIATAEQLVCKEYTQSY